MSEQVVLTVLKLKDNISQPLSKSSKNIKTFQDHVKQTKESMSKFKKSVTSGFKSVAKSAVKLGSSLGGFDAIKKGMSECVSEAKNMIEAERKLVAAFEATGKATTGEIEGLNKYADLLERNGVVGADVTTSFQQQLATYDLTAESVKALSAGSVDLIAQMEGVNAAQEAGINVGDIMGKVMSGQTSALSEVGISFSEAQDKILKFGTEEEKAATLANVLKENVGGVNKALSETDVGQIESANNQLGSFKEMIGRKILPIQAKFASWFTTNMPMIEEITLKIFTVVEEAIAKLIPHIENLWTWLKDAFESDAMASFIEILQQAKDVVVKIGESALNLAQYVIDNWSKFEPLVVGIVGAFVAFKVAMATAKVILIGIEVAQLAFNAAMGLNPIALVVIAIGALIAIGVILYRNWDQIKIKVGEVWTGFKDFIAGITEKFPLVSIVIESVIEKWKEIFEGVKSTFTGIIDFITGIFTTDWGVAWDGVKNIFKGVFEGLEAVAKAPINGVIGLMNLLIDKINGFSFDLPDWLGNELGVTSVGFNIPKIPNLALGSIYTKGGAHEIHDGPHGGEIVDLPNGSRVIPADKSKKMVEKLGGMRVYVTIQGNVIGNEQFVDDIGNKVAFKIKNAIANI